MSLIVETGAGLADAESYISVADATTYHAARGNAAWSALASDTIREQALRKATDYMLGAYGERWKGQRINSTQALDWPRVDAWRTPCIYLPSDAVPEEVRRACAELALRASSADLAVDLERGVLRERIGAIETEYDPASPEAVRYRAVDMSLRGLLLGGGGAVRVLRG